MKKNNHTKLLLALFTTFVFNISYAQHTFSIVAVDPVTGEIGTAGGTCLDINDLNGEEGAYVINEIIAGIGSICSQANYSPATQALARTFMEQGQPPSQILTLLDNNDTNYESRQYGIVDLIGGAGNTARTAGHTGTGNPNASGDIQGTNFSVQGNTLVSQDVLTAMRDGFLNTTGTLADKLMAAMQGARIEGGDNRCSSEGTSCKSAFLRVMKPSDLTDVYGHVSIDLNVSLTPSGTDPINILQNTYDYYLANLGTTCTQTINSYPHVESFEDAANPTGDWVQSANILTDDNPTLTHINNTEFNWTRRSGTTPSGQSGGNTGPTSANDGTFYAYTEASGANQGFPTKRALLTSPCFDLTNKTSATFTFGYHMFGANTGDLAVRINTGTGWNTIWIEEGNQGNAWNNGSIDLVPYIGQTIQLRFDSNTGLDFASDTAIDNIRVSAIEVGACINATLFDNRGITGWDNGIPTINSTATITEDYNTETLGVSIDACELTITNNATLTIAAGDYLNVFGNITIDSGASLIIEHEASVVQTDSMATVTNNGTINVLLETPELKPRDFILLGSPMTSESAAMVFNSADKVFSHNTANFIPHPDVTALFPMAENFIDDNFNDYTPHTGTITPAEGYLVRPRPINVTGNEVYSITYAQGTLNNGAITYPVTYNDPGDGSLTPSEIKAGSYNLLANPYPSAITASTFIAENPTVSEVFFWESVQSPSDTFPGSFNVNYSMEDVSIYNALGGVAAASDPTTTPNGFIATGQGFAIKANQAGTATFTNTMRVTGNNNTLRNSVVDLDRIWLQISNDDFALSSETLIGFTPNATPGFDSGYDSNRIATALSIFSHLPDGSLELGIQGRELFNEDIQVPLGFSSLVDDTVDYTIHIDNLDGTLIENATVYLVDLTENNITNLTEEGTYTFTASMGTYSNRFILQFVNTIPCDTTTTFNGNGITGWTNDIPSFTTTATITENYNTANQGASIDACELIITNNATLTIAAGDYLNVFGNITVDSGATLIIEHEASLVQTDPMATVTNNGTINVLLETPELKPRDFILLGSPMTTESAAMVFNSADKVFSHNTTNFIPHPDVTALFPMAENFIDDNFNDFTQHTGIINPAEGYLIRPRPITAIGNEVYSITYAQGTVNNGNITYSVTYNDPGDGSLTPSEIKAASFNLLANPYPSAISATTFIANNPTVSEVFFWESVQSPSDTFPGSFNENFSMEDVSMFNTLGGVAAASDPTTTPNGFIATGQGFSIKANEAGTATFTNSMRITGNNNTLRTANLESVNKLWIAVSNETYNKQSETLIGFTDQATADFDQGYDSNRIATAVSLYSHITNSDKELAIQSVGAFTNDMQIALGFSTMIDTQTIYTISLKNFEGIDLENTTVYLVDTFENSTTNISKETYNFTATAGTYNNRFIVQFRDNTALSTSNFNQDTISIFPNPTNGELFINNTSGEIIETIKITDVRGKLLHTQTVSSNSYTMDIHSLAPAIYFVTITTEKGSVVKQIIKK